MGRVTVKTVFSGDAPEIRAGVEDAINAHIEPLIGAHVRFHIIPWDSWEKDAVDALKAGKINCVVQCTPNLGPAAMELVRSLTSGETISKVTHPEESLFTDFDDLTDPSVEGF